MTSFVKERIGRGLEASQELSEEEESEEEVIEPHIFLTQTDKNFMENLKDKKEKEFPRIDHFKGIHANQGMKVY